VNVYYFGPLGRLMRMDVPQRGFVDNPVELGALHTALSGRRTKDVFGHKRTITIPLENLTSKALSWFEACYLGAVTGPFYLFDPRHLNRLSTSASAMAWPQSGVWTANSGTVTTVAATSTLLSCATPDGTVHTPAPSYANSWNPTVAATLLADSGAYIPVVPGEELAFSAYVVSGNPTLEFIPYNAALVAQAPAAGTVTLAETPARRNVPYSVPSDGSVVAVRAQLRVVGAGTVVTLAWQVSTPQDDGTPDPWVLGSGVPKVLVDDLPERSEHAQYLTSSTLSLLEV
jgi:hypothetical protein